MNKSAFWATVSRVLTSRQGLVIGAAAFALSGGIGVWALHAISPSKPSQLSQTAVHQAATLTNTSAANKPPTGGQQSNGSPSAQKANSAAGLSEQPLNVTTDSGVNRSAAAPKSGSIAPADRRAMWVWNSDSIVASSSSQSQLFDFAAGKGVQTLYFYSEGLINSNPAALKSFITAAAARSIDVELLFGEPEWALNSGHAAAVSFMNKAVAFAQSLPGGSRPVGAHFDVEPSALAAWGSDPAGTAGQYLGMLNALRAAKGPLRLSVDAAMAYDYLTVSRNGTSKELTKWVIDATDGVTLMSYRDHAAAPDGIIDHGAMSVAYAASVGKRATLGVETTCGLDPEKITFCEEGGAVLEAELAKVKAEYRGSAGFNGVAIHDYTAYRTLAP